LGINHSSFVVGACRDRAGTENGSLINYQLKGLDNYYDNRQ
jgi:hypothetical protein